jgi:uncharacterized membrane protein YqjE
MADTGMPQQRDAAGAGGPRNDSLGELVSLAIRDVSQLVRWEIDLAKLELRDDMKRYGISGAMFGIAGFAGLLILTLLSFALAYGLITVGIWPWAAFLIAAGVYVVIAGVAALIGVSKAKHPTGLRRTRTTVQGDIAMLKHSDSAGKPAQPE